MLGSSPLHILSDKDKHGSNCIPWNLAPTSVPFIACFACLCEYMHIHTSLNFSVRFHHAQFLLCLRLYHAHTSHVQTYTYTRWIVTAPHEGWYSLCVTYSFVTYVATACGQRCGIGASRCKQQSIVTGSTRMLPRQLVAFATWWGPEEDRLAMLVLPLPIYQHKCCKLTWVPVYCQWAQSIARQYLLVKQTRPSSMLFMSHFYMTKKLRESNSQVMKGVHTLKCVVLQRWGKGHICTYQRERHKSFLQPEDSVRKAMLQWLCEDQIGCGGT